MGMNLQTSLLTEHFAYSVIFLCSEVEHPKMQLDNDAVLPSEEGMS